MNSLVRDTDYTANEIFSGAAPERKLNYNQGNTMRNSVIRIAMWASAGFLVSVGWEFYFASANKATPIGPIVYTLARLTQPVIAVAVSYVDFPMGLRVVEVANAATYALIGLILTTIRRHHWPVQISN